MGESDGGMTWENGIETCILSHVKQIASPDSVHETVRECLMGGFLRAVSHESFVPLQAEQHAAPRD